MSITRSKTIVELIAQRTPTATRSDLDVYSKSEVDAEIAGVDLSLYTQLSTTASISGGLDLRIDVLEIDSTNIQSDLESISTEVIAISGDVIDLDISLTEAIFTHVTVDGTTPSVSGSMNAWGKITAISGGPFYIQLFK